nr:MAG TPA: hypothetical protein [Caudoviricetes sp.]
MDQYSKYRTDVYLMLLIINNLNSLILLRL